MRIVLRCATSGRYHMYLIPPLYNNRIGLGDILAILLRSRSEQDRIEGTNNHCPPMPVPRGRIPASCGHMYLSWRLTRTDTGLWYREALPRLIPIIWRLWPIPLEELKASVRITKQLGRPMLVQPASSAQPAQVMAQPLSYEPALSYSPRWQLEDPPRQSPPPYSGQYAGERTDDTHEFLWQTDSPSRRQRLYDRYSERHHQEPSNHPCYAPPHYCQYLLDEFYAAQPPPYNPPSQDHGDHEPQPCTQDLDNFDYQEFQPHNGGPYEIPASRYTPPPMQWAPEDLDSMRRARRGYSEDGSMNVLADTTSDGWSSRGGSSQNAAPEILPATFQGGLDPDYTAHGGGEAQRTSSPYSGFGAAGSNHVQAAHEAAEDQQAVLMYSDHGIAHDSGYLQPSFVEGDQSRIHEGLSPARVHHSYACPSHDLDPQAAAYADFDTDDDVASDGYHMQAAGYNHDIEPGQYHQSSGEYEPWQNPYGEVQSFEQPYQTADPGQFKEDLERARFANHTWTAPVSSLGDVEDYAGNESWVSDDSSMEICGLLDDRPYHPPRSQDYQVRGTYRLRYARS